METHCLAKVSSINSTDAIVTGDPASNKALTGCHSSITFTEIIGPSTGGPLASPCGPRIYIATYIVAVLMAKGNSALCT